MKKELLLLIALVVWFVYLPLNRRKSVHHFRSRFEGKIPLIPIAVWPYILFIPYLLFTTILLWNSTTIYHYLVSFSIAGALGSTFWFLFPNGVIRPKIKPSKNLSEKILHYIYQHDKDTNGFPSGHVFYTLVASHYLAGQYPNFLVPIGITACCICVSTLTTKQHYIVDIFGGVLVYGIAILATQVIF